MEIAVNIIGQNVKIVDTLLNALKSSYDITFVVYRHWSDHQKFTKSILTT
jgi:hypothetical protein